MTFQIFRPPAAEILEERLVSVHNDVDDALVEVLEDPASLRKTLTLPKVSEIFIRYSAVAALSDPEDAESPLATCPVALI